MAALTLGMQAAYINEEHWQTMVFTTLALAQLGHVFAIRSDHEFIYRIGIFSNRLLLGAVLLTFLLQLAVVYLPLGNQLFRTQPLTLQELGSCILVSVVVFHAVEAEKWVKRWRGKRSRSRS
jgi:Ca2+-transporting ATPase